MAVQTIDFDAEFAAITAQANREKRYRLEPPLVRLWDGNWVLRGRLTRIISADIQDIDNETGIATFELPLDYWMSEWIIQDDKRSTANIFVTVDKDGVRWSGMMESFTVVKNEDGSGLLRVVFKHDYEHLKHVICWSNPFLPAEFQFPRLWIMFGPSAWCLKTTLHCNLLRLQNSLWMLPDDPMNANGWGDLDQSNWQIVVKPGSIDDDNSQFAIVHSRFKSMHEVSKKVVEDAQLSWVMRRYLDGDPEPWPDANLAHGTLVVDLVDKSGYTTGTSFWGNIFSGLVRAFVHIESDGLTEGVDIINDPSLPPEGQPEPEPPMPAEYRDPFFLGTLPEAPWVIYRDNEFTGIQTSEFTMRPATDTRIVAGGHSMPGVNELISAAIQMAGDLTAAIPFVPPLGGVADAILKPLYTDVVLAFGTWGNQQRAQRLGHHRYYEHFAQGGDRAYTLAWLLAMRTGMWITREQTSHKVVVADGAPYRIGERGYGHFYKGDRVGSTVRGQTPGRVFVDRVSEVRMSWSRNESPVWNITIGVREPEDPVIKAFEMIQEILSIAQELGVL